MPCRYSLSLILIMWNWIEPGYAQDRFFWQFEAGQGFFFAPGVDPYTFSAQAHPSFDLSASSRNFIIGASLAEVYNNPDWSFMWGGRFAFYISKLRKKPVKYGPQFSYGTLHLTGAVLLESTEVRRLAGGLIIDVWEGALLISPRFGYDRKFERTYLEVGLGMGF